MVSEPVAVVLQRPATRLRDVHREFEMFEAAQRPGRALERQSVLGVGIRGVEARLEVCFPE
jgi:hypothetical protein